ncbi:MAG: hypothetical protein WC073_05205 [Sterolibacterium sp.]
MTATNEAQDEVIANEFREANARMTIRERALVNGIHAAVDGIHEAIDLLELLIMDERLEGFNGDHSKIVREVTRRLANAAEKALGTHAAVVGDILEPTVQ